MTATTRLAPALLPALLGGILLLASSPATAQSTLYGNSFISGGFYGVNKTTGSATFIGNTGVSNLDGITYRAQDGLMYGLNNGGTLYKVNVSTGAATTVGATGFTFIEADIANDPTTGILYGIQEFSTNSYRLASINAATGAGSIVATMTGVADLSAGAFDASGQLWMLDTGVTGNSNLLRVNKATGAITSSLALSVNLGSAAGMSFNPDDGILYAADGGTAGTNNLYTINTTTGLATLIGPTGGGDGLAGLAFVPSATPAAVPEPGVVVTGLVMAGTTGLGLVRGRLRRRKAA